MVIIMDFKKKDFIKKIIQKEVSFCIIVGYNGSGKTTLLNELYKEADDKNIGFYTINNNRQFIEANPFNANQYKDCVISHILSTGESLKNEIRDILDNKDKVILDEPTATLDLLNTSIIIEAFMRSSAELKIISSNDYLTLKLLSCYIDQVYDVSKEKITSITEYIDSMINDTKKELKKTHFQEIDYEFYDSLKIK